MKDAFQVDANLAGKTLSACLRVALKDHSWGQVRKLCQTGKVRVNGQVVSEEALRMRSGDVITIREDAPRLRKGNLPKAEIVYEDHEILVVNKPPGLLTLPLHSHRTHLPQESSEDSLLARVRLAVDQRKLRSASLFIVHRLDQDTSGLILVSRTRESTRALKAQFTSRTITREYLALAYGKMESGTLRSLLIEDRGDGLRGSLGVFRKAQGPTPKHAKEAITHIQHLEGFREACLLSCQLDTGRQHQIRIHLSEAGCPIIGERVYIRDFQGKRIPANRHMLHATRLSFIHPRSKKKLTFTQEAPGDFQSLVERLRKR